MGSLRIGLVITVVLGGLFGHSGLRFVSSSLVIDVVSSTSIGCIACILAWSLWLYWVLPLNSKGLHFSDLSGVIVVVLVPSLVKLGLHFGLVIVVLGSCQDSHLVKFVVLLIFWHSLPLVVTSVLG